MPIFFCIKIAQKFGMEIAETVQIQDAKKERTLNRIRYGRKKTVPEEKTRRKKNSIGFMQKQMSSICL